VKLYSEKCSILISPLTQPAIQLFFWSAINLYLVGSDSNEILSDLAEHVLGCPCKNFKNSFGVDSVCNKIVSAFTQPAQEKYV
jgi:hypothetical protein